MSPRTDPQHSRSGAVASLIPVYEFGTQSLVVGAHGYEQQHIARDQEQGNSERCNNAHEIHRGAGRTDSTTFGGCRNLQGYRKKLSHNDFSQQLLAIVEPVVAEPASSGNG